MDNADDAQQLNTLGIQLADRFSHTGIVADIEAAIHTFQQAIAAAPRRAERAGYRSNLGNAYRRKFLRIGEMVDFERAIFAFREAIADHPDLTIYLDNLGTLFHDGFSRTGVIRYLDESICIARQAVDGTQDDNSEKARRLDNLGVRLGNRFSRIQVAPYIGEAILAAADIDNIVRAAADIDEAIHVGRQAIIAASTDDNNPARARYFNDLGASLHLRFSYVRVKKDLDEAVRVFQKAINATAIDNPERARYLANLGSSLGDRFTCFGRMPDIDRAIGVSRQAAEITPGGHPERPRRLNNLAVQLGNRAERGYSRIAAMVDLEEAIRVHREAFQATYFGHPDRALYLSNLGLRLGDRFTRTQATADLDEAIRVINLSLYATPYAHPKLWERLNNLGIRLGQRFGRYGEMTDLDRAIAVARKVVGATSGAYLDRARHLNNLGIYLAQRFQRVGATEDIDEAVEAMERAVNATPHSHPERARFLNNLGIAFGERFFRMAVLTDIDKAISAVKEALDATPIKHPARARYFNNLGILYGEKFEKSKEMPHLEEAIRVTRKALEATPAYHELRAGRLNNLGVYLGQRFTCTGKIKDINEAIRVVRTAVNAAPDNHPVRAERLVNLGTRLSDRFRRTRARSDLDEAKNLFYTILHFTGARISLRIEAGHRFITTPNILQDTQAYAIAKATIGLLPLFAPQSLMPADRQHYLSNVVGLSSDAAAIALHAGKGARSAIELLETGRGVIASSLQDMRTELSSLNQSFPSLAHSFVELRNHLDPPASHNLEVAGAALEPSPAERRHNAMAQMTRLLEKIRSKSKFARFLVSATDTQMRKAAAFGPIVIINVSSHRCDALIISSSRFSLRELQITRQDVLTREKNLQSFETLRWLWDNVVGPVLETLGFTETPTSESWSHIRWIPTGPLVRFPLHAAGHHRIHGTESTLDRVVSTYSSSVKTIFLTQPKRHEAKSSQAAVLVAMQETPGEGTLRYATDEVQAVRLVCESMGMPSGECLRNTEEVLSALKTCKVFHFAGHGFTHPRDPLQSQLLLNDWQDHPLTVARLLEVKLSSKLPFMAYLSACGTGRILAQRSLDESIHLTNSFQLAGFRHVVGTLWDVEDRLSVDMARMLYETLRTSGLTDAAVSCGLHHATRSLRQQWFRDQNIELKQSGSRTIALSEGDVQEATPPWVPYVHYGV
ncbi:hypothetical protein PCL_07380 [Purpureocillium lilacinum]|uniref:CHAT domain-containing protein n=1 Tax=Purpureocillium lilacinum TaxID=33203 RepID=A0A2U3DS44_PURLI|nr:hypothetical protein PCL_07380 [Purpureocillium lilacinum]